MSALPKFNFKAVDLTDEQLTEQLAENAPKGEGKYFRPGLAQLEVTSAEYKGPSADTTWSKWLLKFTGAGGKEASDMILVPSSKLTYTDRNGKESLFAMERLKNLLEALGAEVKVKTIGDTLSVYFGKEDALKGQTVGAQMGFPGTHVKYLGKNGESKRYSLAYRSGDQYKDAPEFDTWDGAAQYAESKGIELKRFVEILKYEPSASGNKKPDSNW
jgi:hypothetical protein